MVTSGAAKVVGLRHGEVHNPDWVIYAGLDGFGLSALGIQQARSAAEEFCGRGFEAIYCSPLERAVQTATIVGQALALDPVSDARLTEWKFWGRWAGKGWQEVRDEDPVMLETYLKDPGLLEGDESLDELTLRVADFVDEVAGKHAGLVLAVAHLEPLRAYVRHRDGLASSKMGSIEIPTGGWVDLK